MPSITFTPVVPVQQRRADRTYGVKIRLTFKRVSRWIATNISVTDGQLTRAKKIKDAAVLASIDALIGDLRGTVAALSPFALEDMTVDDVLKFIREKKTTEAFRLDFFEFGEEYGRKQAPAGAAETVSTLNALERFLDRRQLDVNAITAAMLGAFVEFIEAEPVMSYNRYKGTLTRSKKAKMTGNAASVYISRLRRIFSAAKLAYNDEDAGIIRIPRDPFSRVTVKAPVHHGQHSLGVETIQRIISARPASANQQWALDTFVLSFATMGANLADLFAAAPPVAGVWAYERQKTRARRRDRALMRVAIQPCLAGVLARLQDPAGSGRWLRLHRDGESAPRVTARLNYYLKQWAKENGIEEFTMYAARHSWATIARSKAVGVDKATVDDCLNHVGDRAVADIYIEKDFEIFDDANRRVLALFEW